MAHRSSPLRKSRHCLASLATGKSPISRHIPLRYWLALRRGRGCDVSKATPIQTILRQHSNAISDNHALTDQINSLRDGVMGTFVYVPEFGHSCISGNYALDAAAASFE